MSDKNFTKSEAIWIGVMGLLQVIILTAASLGFWDFKDIEKVPYIELSNQPGQSEGIAGTDQSKMGQ